MNPHLPLSLDNTCVLVTGGAGFIGSHLVEQLIDCGAQVTVVDNLATGSLKNLENVIGQVHLIVGDLGDLLRWGRVEVNQYSHIFHLSANPYIPPSVKNPIYDFHLNLYNTLMLLEAMRESSKAKRLVNTSSAAVYGNPAHLPIRESDPTVPICPYGVSKLAAERYVAVYSQIYGIPATSLRLFSVYGPRQRKQVIYDFIHKLRTDPEHLEILGDGSQERDFVYVQDVVQAMLLAATVAPGKGETYNVASGKSYSIAELAQACCSVCKVTPEITYTGHIRPGDAEKWVVEISALQNLGFTPKTSILEGLCAIRDWYDAYDD
ncbi:MAG: GDP-mannose 4,6-dehydratase [Anaerolineae bacterium]|nr:GDP-mannose 4,6-dehydratase [Anaerolineae bacterium]